MKNEKILTVNPARREVKPANAKVKREPESYRAKYRRAIINRWLGE